VAIPVIASTSALAGFAAAVVLRRRGKRLALGPQAPITLVPKDRHPVHPVQPGPEG
jgi:hypothetical protein